MINSKIDVDMPTIIKGILTGVIVMTPYSMLTSTASSINRYSTNANNDHDVLNAIYILFAITIVNSVIVLYETSRKNEMSVYWPNRYINYSIIYFILLVILFNNVNFNKVITGNIEAKIPSLIVTAYMVTVNVAIYMAIITIGYLINQPRRSVQSSAFRYYYLLIILTALIVGAVCYPENSHMGIIMSIVTIVYSVKSLLTIGG